jgi:hypothetical protein
MILRRVFFIGFGGVYGKSKTNLALVTGKGRSKKPSGVCSLRKR